jgi:hypothetical protein
VAPASAANPMPWRASVRSVIFVVSPLSVTSGSPVAAPNRPAASAAVRVVPGPVVVEPVVWVPAARVGASVAVRVVPGPVVVEPAAPVAPGLVVEAAARVVPGPAVSVSAAVWVVPGPVVVEPVVWVPAVRAGASVAVRVVPGPVLEPAEAEPVAPGEPEPGAGAAEDRAAAGREEPGPVVAAVRAVRVGCGRPARRRPRAASRRCRWWLRPRARLPRPGPVGATREAFPAAPVASGARTEVLASRRASRADGTSAVAPPVPADGTRRSISVLAVVAAGRTPTATGVGGPAPGTRPGPAGVSSVRTSRAVAGALLRRGAAYGRVCGEPGSSRAGPDPIPAARRLRRSPGVRRCRSPRYPYLTPTR